jgi:hypothetical protein
VHYVISDIHVYNQIVKFDLLNDHELDSHHRPLTLTLKFTMHKTPLEDYSHNKINLLFEKNKSNLFLKDLNIELNLLSYKKNIEDLYHNFTTILSLWIKIFFIEVLCKKNNRVVNPWY